MLTILEFFFFPAQLILWHFPLRNLSFSLRNWLLEALLFVVQRVFRDFLLALY